MNSGGKFPIRRLIRCSSSLVACALFAAGCAHLQPAPVVDRGQALPLWREHQAQLSAIHDFSLQGRIAERGLGGARGDFSWSQDGEQFEVRVSGPLGVGALVVRGRPDAVEIRTKDGVFQTGDPEAFMREQLGWSLPLAQLRWWVLGLPAPGSAPQMMLDALGRAATLNQQGWQIDYTEYQSVQGVAQGTMHDLALPRTIELVGGEHRFRLVIDQWTHVATQGT